MSTSNPTKYSVIECHLFYIPLDVNAFLNGLSFVLLSTSMHVVAVVLMFFRYSK
jgi:hypothetical protein